MTTDDPGIDTRTLLRLACELNRLIYGPHWAPPNPELLKCALHVPTVRAIVEDLCAAATMIDAKRDAVGDLFAYELRRATHVAQELQPDRDGKIVLGE